MSYADRDKPFSIAQADIGVDYRGDTVDTSPSIIRTYAFVPSKKKNLESSSRLLFRQN